MLIGVRQTMSLLVPQHSRSSPSPWWSTPHSQLDAAAHDPAGCSLAWRGQDISFQFQTFTLGSVSASSHPTPICTFQDLCNYFNGHTNPLIHCKQIKHIPALHHCPGIVKPDTTLQKALALHITI